ncbi:MAG TPA: stage III sporulation protein AA [Candidatus Merdenecus merdavium]|nr:stage III sporulation protein AA [Candidatus Merdenecus merdavium]
MNIQSALKKVDQPFEYLQEIRLRVDKPLILAFKGEEYFIQKDGTMTKKTDGVFICEKKDLMETMEYIGNYSLYAYEEEIRQGFLTIQGGHRVGVAGKIIMDGNKIKGMKHISYINVRISHQITGCANEVMPYIRNGEGAYHTLIVSPPRCGKTTLLRDMIRQLSNGDDVYEGLTVGVVDERSEIGGSYMGVPQNDLGMRTDVLDCCPKADGMLMLIRSMSPRIVCVDEIGDFSDIHAIESVIHCGCKFIATVHGSSIEDIKKKPLLQKFIQERIFERYVILCNDPAIGSIAAIFDERGTSLLKRQVDKI